MSKKIERKDRNFKFETLQLHVGQEESGSGYRCKSSTNLSDIFLCISATAIMQQHVSDLQMQVTFTDVLQTRQRTYSRRESQHLEGGSAALAVASGAAAITYTDREPCTAG